MLIQCYSPQMHRLLVILILFVISRAAFGSEVLCAYLLTAHSEIDNEVPVAWREVESRLRSKIRTGWIKRGIPYEIAESVLEHSQKVRQAALAYASAHPEINGQYAGKMALIHDVGEAVAPDFTPEAKISTLEKFDIEKNAWEQIVQNVGPLAIDLMKLWLEFEAGESPESRLVKQLDKLDAGVQALRYEKLGYHQVADFFPYSRRHLTDPLLISIFNILLEKKISAHQCLRSVLFFIAGAW